MRNGGKMKKKKEKAKEKEEVKEKKEDAEKTTKTDEQKQKEEAKRLSAEGLTTTEVGHALGINKYDASKLIKG
jgi:F0F1-type ATP synthase assembly protein I